MFQTGQGGLYWGNVIMGGVGHYRVTHQCAVIALQAANSRLFEIRNSSATNFLVPTRLDIKWLQTAAHTAAIEDSLDVFKVNTFSAVDTVNTVTPVTVVKHTAKMLAAPGAAVVRGVTIAGAAAGMTGGTLTKEGSALAQLPQWLLLAQPTSSTVFTQLLDAFWDGNGTHPLVLGPNEGLIVENRVLLGAAAGSSVYIDLSWAETVTW